MISHQTPTPIEKRFLSLVGVTASSIAILWASPITFFSRLITAEHSFFFLQFERHFWQFFFAFIAVVVLSRGHLWSYGINSKNLKASMVWLAWLYTIVIIVTLITFLLDKEFLPSDASQIPFGSHHMIIAMLVYWMSSPVANQILFFSFGQTILMKQWGDTLTVAGVPIVVLFSSILFTFAATTSQFSIGHYSPILTLALGLFCGTVYWKTNSLIAPMLGQAFYFGFPLFIHMIRSTFLK